MRDKIETEFETAELGHLARVKRVQSVGRSWAAAPRASFPKMVESDAELQGLYGLFENEAVDYREVLGSHARASRDRVAASDDSVVLVLQDTTDFTFSGNSIREGLGWVSQNQQGFFAHFALAVSADGTARPYGVVGMSIIMRERPPPRGTPRKKHNGKSRFSDPARESLRWGALANETTALLRGHASAIHVTDREAESFEYLSERLRQNQRFVARARELARPVTSLSRRDEATTLLRLAAERAVPVVAREAVLSRRVASPFPSQRKKHPPREQRVAHLEFAAERVNIARPPHLPKTLPSSIELNVVHVREPSPPDGLEPVEWLLLTSEAVDSADEILRVVDHYRARWTIEEFHQAIKTGCQYESRQLESARGLLLALAICIPIAWQMLVLRHQARVEPDAPASAVLSESRLAALRTIARRPLSSEPTAREVLLAIAALGGHIARNGPPGWKTLRLGLDHLLIVEAAFEARDARQRSDQ